MATERELRDQAALVRLHLDAVRDRAGSLPEWVGHTGLVGGSHQQRIVGGLATQIDHAGSLVEALGDLAEDLEQRANDCAAYRERLQSWRRELEHWETAESAHRAAAMVGLPIPHPGTAPSPPAPPFPEAEAD